jgi:hypothetical protein
MQVTHFGLSYYGCVLWRGGSLDTMLITWYFMEPEVPMLCSQEPTIDPRPEQAESVYTL